MTDEAAWSVLELLSHENYSHSVINKQHAMLNMLPSGHNNNFTTNDLFNIIVISDGISKRALNVADAQVLFGN